jgi:hypothetical protein
VVIRVIGFEGWRGLALLPILTHAKARDASDGTAGPQSFRNWTNARTFGEELRRDEYKA